MAGQQPPGWYNDPTARFSNRYWDGDVWTDAVSSGGTNATDPIAPGETHGPPAPGTEARTAPSQAANVPAVNVNAAGGSSGASVIGPIIAVIAVLIAVILLVVVLTGGDDTTDEEVPATTEAPDTTEAPPDSEGDGG
ncbi:MAG: DUF2510 domain-containing protein [Acidimicrobiales bacterium]